MYARRRVVLRCMVDDQRPRPVHRHTRHQTGPCRERSFTPHEIGHFSTPFTDIVGDVGADAAHSASTAGVIQGPQSRLSEVVAVALLGPP